MKKLRIFYASATSPNAVFESQLWRSNLHDTLVDLGHDVVEFDFDLRETFLNLNPQIPSNREFIARNRPKICEALLEQVRTAHAQKPIDILFTYFYDACATPECIREIRSLGIVAVNWYCNASYQLDLVSEIAPHYDWCLVPEENRLDDYRAIGAQPIYCQEAANPNVYKPSDVPCEFDVTFVGYGYGERPGYIRRLRDAGIDVRVWGFGWDAHLQKEGSTRKGLLPAHICGGILSDQQLIQMYSRSRINLGFSACAGSDRSGKRVTQLRLRDFEIPMSGGFYLVEAMPELEGFFEVGTEVACYDGADDLVERVRYYLEHEEQRGAIRQAGMQRARRDHTWHRRFENAFEQMGLGVCVA